MKRREAKLSAEERSALVKAIDHLPKMQASLLVLHYLENKPLEDVAKTLSLSPKEMAHHHHAALIALRRWNEKFDGV